MSEIPEDVMEVADKALDFGPDATRLKHSIAKAILADRQRDQWHPISTAPKDGNWIMLHSPDHALPEFAYWDGDEWATGNCGLSPVFTHWMPLPPAPKGGE